MATEVELRVNSFIGGLKVFADSSVFAGLSAATVRIGVANSPYTVLSTDKVIFCDTSGGAITVNLPAGTEGRHYKICNTGSSAVTVAGNGSENVYGSSTQVVAAGEVLDLHYNTSDGWW